MKSVAHTLCGAKKEEKLEEHRKRIKSIIREELDLPDNGKVFLHLGFSGTSDITNHSVIFLESLDKESNRKIRKVELVYEAEGNSSAGSVLGNPALIRVNDVTGKDEGKEEWKTEINYLSEPLLITEKQKDKFLKKLDEESQKKKLYNISGNHSSYQSLFSGADYDSCISLTTKLLEEAGIIEKGKGIKWDQAVLLPRYLMTKIKMIQPKDIRKQNLELLNDKEEMMAKIKALEDENERLKKLQKPS